MICASLCAYLLLGLFWAEAVHRNPGRRELAQGVPKIVELTTETFSSNLEPDVAHDPSTSRAQRFDELFMTAIYLSFVTLTTLGFGDITPVSDARER